MDVRVAVAAMGPTLSDSQGDEMSAIPGVSLHYRAYALEWMPDPWWDLEHAGGWLRTLERELAPDLIHLNQYAFAAVEFEAPVIVAAHSCVVSWWRAVHGCEPPDEWRRYRDVVREGLVHADCIVAPTHAMLATLHENYGVSGARNAVIPNARSMERYRPGIKEPVVFAAGRLWDAAKNVAALERVAPRVPWPIRVAGSSVAPAGEARAWRNVVALGDLTAAEVARELARASIYALPARYEPFGLSILEAALAGCALVLGDIASLREVWGSTARYVAPDDDQALHACLLQLMANDELCRCLGHAARARALTFTPERQANAYLDAYAAITDTDAAEESHVTVYRQGETAACAS
jgi:glycosyltransferase involved in cell wall biosynthesis